MSRLIDIPTGLTRAWTAAYTTGLPSQVKQERRSEIESDLWEQQESARIEGGAPLLAAAETLARLVLGIPADLSWRAEAGSAARQEGKIQVKDTVASRLVFGVAVLIGLLPVLMGAATVVDTGVFGASADEDASDNIIFGAVSMLAGAVMVTGLLLSKSSPRFGLPVLAVGVIGIAVFWYWMFVITVPVGIALLAVAYLRAGRVGWPRGTGTA